MAPCLEVFRKHISKFIEKRGNGSKKETVQHFVKEGVPPIAIYKILQRLGKRRTIKRKVGSGCKPIIMIPKKVEAICKTFKMSKNMSYCIAAQKFKCSETPIHFKAKIKLNIVNHKQKFAL